MDKKIYISAICALAMSNNILAQDIGTIEVTEKINTKVVENISGEEVKSADLAEALNKNIPSISLIRRSGIANDVILRGQKRDNIKVTIDGTVVCGACVNRMDPPTSHVVTHAIEDVEVKEGPFDVEEFGTLSGGIKIKTKKPTEQLSGDIGVNIGSFGYKKASTTISGGNEDVKVLFTASKEEGEQYKDGNGNDLATQLSNFTASTAAATDDPFNFSNTYKNMDAFEKTMYMGKIFVDVDDDQDLRLSYTANRSDNVLYPSSKMDAIWDDSDIINMEYSIKNLSSYSKKLDLQLYNSEVDHPMSTQYRVSGAVNFSTNHLTTDMTGLKIKNNFDFLDRSITYGVDISKRNWDGKYTKTNVATGTVTTIGNSLDDVDTKNVGLFAKCERTIDKLDIEVGARYDDTKVDTSSLTENDTDFNSLSANIFATYNADNSLKYFAGIGKSSRVPDARELYNIKYNPTGTVRTVNGTPSLDQTKNYEIDLGVEKTYENSKVKLKTFYSKLKDYIYYNSTKGTADAFENINATIYGAELTTSYTASDDLFFEAGLSYKKGKKDTLPTGQTDTDLAEMTPLKLNASVTYDYDEKGDIELSFIAADSWDEVDEENGEQKLSGYGIVNLKTTRELNDGFELTVGADNIFDKTYATTNTYKDLILMTDNTDTMLINEPGRYIYANIKYSF